MNKFKRKTDLGYLVTIIGNYNRSKPAFDRLAETLKQDFPEIKDADIELSVITQSDRYKHMSIVRATVKTVPSNAYTKEWDGCFIAA